MTSYVYRSAFSGDSSATTSSDATTSFPTPASSFPAITEKRGEGSFASFICHVAYLEASLRRGEKSVFFKNDRLKFIERKRIGHGASFFVDKVRKPAESGGTAKEGTAMLSTPKAEYVAVKTVREDPRSGNNWRNVLLEIRVLLHEPIRYHPNIVRLLDIVWDASNETGSSFPTLVQEFADFGTLDNLQRDRQLPFSVKQKLCYDVGRGLSILHACGIVHGDLKHENVLVFKNRYSSPPGQLYTAKLADFGATVMDMDNEQKEGTHTLLMHTFPYEAPETGQKLSVGGIKKTDAFSYGMLIWRCMLDCPDNLLSTIGLGYGPGRPTEETRTSLNKFKSSDELLERAIASLSAHHSTRELPSASIGLIITSLMFTLRGDPAQRALDRAQARLRGMSATESNEYVAIKDVVNKKRLENLKKRTPGSHGMDLDSVGFNLGRTIGDDYDAQNNLPGYRPDLPQPEKGEFLFEPLRLKHILAWNQQQEMVTEFTSAANAPKYDEKTTEIQPWSAAFFLYQSYLCGFGVSFDPVQACYWLRQAAGAKEETATVDYLAKAWLFRIHTALEVPLPTTPDEQLDELWWSIIRGHRHCLDDSNAIIKQSTNEKQRDEWEARVKEADWNYRRRTGGTGMPYFISRKLTRKWDSEDPDALDNEIKAEVGNSYNECLRPGNSHSNSTTEETVPEGGYRFDKIYVNHKGHGLLHIAASLGNVNVLKHLCQKYKCNINITNQSHSETPLTCACRSGHFGCVLFLLENGADANGAQFGEESPLHCITNFDEVEMEAVVRRLLSAGADIEKHTNASRKDIRRILADWEDNLSMTLTPLGRAVLLQSLTAVKVLLKHGANPWAKRIDRNRSNISPIELAAILTLPEILQTMLSHSPQNPDVDSSPLFDECGMLQKARSEEITPYDTLSKQSRLVRCGLHYKTWLAQTLRILRNRRLEHGLAEQESASGKQLCAEISLGNIDIVETLLDLGHPVGGSPGYRPVEAAVSMNNLEMLELLITRGASLDIRKNFSSHALFAVLADHPRHTPRDISVLQYLIRREITPGRPHGGEPSALALAVRNGYFELADLLAPVSSGADINSSFAWPDSGERKPLLGLFLGSHTYSSLQGLEYLLSLHKSRALEITIHPLVEELDGTSAIHALALYPLSEWNSHSQTSARISQTILEMFPNPTNLGLLATHPSLGTPMTAAVLSGNTHVLSTLLDSEYRVNADQAVDVAYPLHCPNGRETLTPAALACKVAQLMVAQFSGKKDELRREDVAELRTRVDIAITLLSVAANSEEGNSGSKMLSDLETMKNQFGRILEHMATSIKDRERKSQADPSGKHPVDLSIITEEKPVAWKEGEEMTAEDAMRVFLKMFRSGGEGSLGDPIHAMMDKAYNKRPVELQMMKPNQVSETGETSA